ncbi:MAG: aminoglycoside phosphotransferase family protein [Planctomycetota bacterium]
MPDAEAHGSESKDRYLDAAREVLGELGISEAQAPRLRPVSGHSSSLLVPCTGVGGEPFLLKYFHPPAEGRFYPAGVNLDDYSRRETAFYRLLDTTDPDRNLLPAPRTIVVDAGDPPRWILLERIDTAVGPAEEVLGQDHVFALLEQLQNIPIESLVGRRNFPLNRWDPVSYLERVRLMYDPVLYVIGEERWTRTQDFFTEALRWIETREPVLVHGDFTEQNIIIDGEGQPFLLDFERVGTGNRDHDFAWFWIHGSRSKDWKTGLVERYLGRRVGSDRIRSEWGIRSALVYLALRRLRFGFLQYAGEDQLATQNLALLDAALHGGSELFPC